MAPPPRRGKARLSSPFFSSPFFSWVLGLSVLAACTSQPAELPRGDAGASPPAEAGGACAIDDGAGGEPVSFERDLMPFFSTTCAFGGCHDGLSKLAGLYLGPNFTDGTADAETRRAVHESLLSPAHTTDDLPRVTPFEPSRSFLMLKVTGCQNEAALSCNGGVKGAPCGARMPALSDPLPTASRRKLAAWIAQGATAD